MSKWNQLANKESVDKTIKALKVNGIDAQFVENGEKAKEEVLRLVPQGTEVMTMSSVTIQTIGLVEAIDGSGKYDAVKPKLMKMDRVTQGREMQKLGAAPDWTIGSVHAVTEDGHVLIASNSGSQLQAYVYGASHVIWVVGAQKIVKNTDEGVKRIYEYVLPLEDARARKAYGIGSGVSKLLIINKEKIPGRITMIVVNEVLGF